VTNVPTVIWIDETGTLVRPPERAAPMPIGKRALQIIDMIGGLDQREAYVAKFKDWAHNGAESRYALTPQQVVERSRPRPETDSQAAAHFEIAQHFWRSEGLTDRVIRHFNAAHELQPDNVTFKRQAWSALAVERSGDVDEWILFRQAPAEGEDWPFVTDFNQDATLIIGDLGSGGSGLRIP
jgi:hypothetical protein